MAAGIQRMNGQNLCERRHPRRVLAVDSLRQVPSIEGHAQSALTTTRRNLAVNSETALASLYQTARLSRSKRPTPSEQEDALEDARFTRPVGAKYEIAPSIKPELNVREAP